MSVQFTDNSLEVKAALNAAAIAFLHEAGGLIQGEVKENARVDTGNTKNSWVYVVDEADGVCTIGNPLENAIWEEFGTGEYAVHGDGRKGGWWYYDDEGERHHTFGKTPTLVLTNAFNKLKNKLKKRAEEVLQSHLN